MLSNSSFGEVEVEVKVKEKKNFSEIACFHRKIWKVPGVFLNLSLNLNLAILKMRIAVILNF